MTYSFQFSFVLILLAYLLCEVSSLSTKQFVTDQYFPGFPNAIVVAKDGFGEKFVVFDGGLTIKTLSGRHVAGVNMTGFEGDGQLATLAKFNSIQEIAFHPITNELYIADTNNNRIRKILNNGTILTVAGNGNIFNLQSNIGLPTGLAFDLLGNLYFTERDTSLLRRLNSNGTVSNIAAGGFSNSTLNQPTTLVLANNGTEIFISDSGNGQVKIYNILTGLISILISFDHPINRIAVTKDRKTIFVSYANGVKGYTTGGVYLSKESDQSLGVLPEQDDYLYHWFDKRPESDVIYGATYGCPYGNMLDPNENMCYYYCDGLKETDPAVCNGNGVCIFNATCTCKTGYYNEWCNSECSKGNSGYTPKIYSYPNYEDNSISFYAAFEGSSNVDVSLYIGESKFDPTACLVTGNSSISLMNKNYGQDCKDSYFFNAVQLDTLINSPYVNKSYSGDYLILTVPLTLNSLDSYGVNNNGICNVYSYKTTQMIYLQVSSRVFTDFSVVDSATPYSLKIYPQTFQTDGDGNLDMGFVLESINSTLNKINFHNSSNPSYALAVTDNKYLYTQSSSKFYQVSAKSLNVVSDYRSTLTFAVNMTHDSTLLPISGFVSIKIEYTIITPPSEINLTLSTSVSINNNNWQPKSAFSINDRVFVQLSTSASVQNMYLRVKNAYLCCFKDNFSPYDTGCSSYDSSRMNIWKRVIFNRVVDQLEPILYSYPNIRNLYGYSFKLLSNSISSSSTERRCYIESNVILTTINSRKVVETIQERVLSSLLDDQYSSNLVNGFSISPGSGVVSKATTIQISVMISLVVFLMVLKAFQ